MLFKKSFLTFIIMMTVFAFITAQGVSFTGSFINGSNTIALQFKKVGTEYHGLLQTGGASFAMKANVRGSQMSGTIYAVNGPVEFSATAQSNQMVFSAFGYTDNFFMTSPTHNLANVDLRPYMVDNRVNGNASGDFDYSYSQHSNGHASESKTYPNQAPPANSPYPALKDAELFRLIAGSQVVYYTRTSYVNDNVASSITYVNFCANGTFTMNYDGSFMVEGSYGENAQGAGYGQNSGIWQLVSYNGQPAVYMAFRNGNTGVNPVNRNLILQGRWRVGNTQYAIQRDKVKCP